MANSMDPIYKNEIRRFLYDVYHDKYCIVTFSNDEIYDNEMFEEIKVTDKEILKALTIFVEKNVREIKGFDKFRIFEESDLLVRWIDPGYFIDLEKLINFFPQFRPNSIEIGFQCVKFFDTEVL